MPFAEKPPIMTGNTKDDLGKLRDYLFRMAASLNEAANAPSAINAGTIIGYSKKGEAVTKNGKEASSDIEAVRKNANELKALIIKSAKGLQIQLDAMPDEPNVKAWISEGDSYVQEYCDNRLEELDSYYLAKSEFGTFEETINSRIEATARGVVESYDYAASITSLQSGIDLLQNYYEAINGEIRRGLVLDPDTQAYVVGIVISQAVEFSAEVGRTDPNNPGDGNTYYYVAPNQTFGIYTSTGWQFWINGVKRGWFSSQDSMLHVSNIVVEDKLQLGADWEISTLNGFGLRYIGG